MIDDHALVKADLIASEEVTTVSDCSTSWGRVRETVENIAGTTIVEDIVQIEELMQQLESDTIDL